MPKPNVSNLLGKIGQALKPLRVKWYVFGAQAVVAAGASRTTADIDITVAEVPPTKLIAALKKAGFGVRGDVGSLAGVIDDLRVIPLEHTASGFQLDVVRAGPGLEELMLERAIVRTLGRRRVPFIETNDLLVVKILAGREKDLEDVRSLLRLELVEVNLSVVRARLRELERMIDDSTLVALFDQQLRGR